MIYVGLADHPQLRLIRHGRPYKWRIFGRFLSQPEAEAWLALWLSLPGYVTSQPGPGWRYGYMYLITPYTRED
jgi:hypothetical protein